MSPAPLKLLDRRNVTTVLEAARGETLGLIEQTYRTYGEGHVVNPHSLFLVPPAPPIGRVIALPAGIFSDDGGAMGIKWISSFPGNLALGIERAAAMIVLNDRFTGFPIAVMEGSVVSAWRTALSACLACSRLDPTRSARRFAIVGCGLIAARTVQALRDAGWDLAHASLFDLSAERAEAMATRLHSEGIAARVSGSASEAVSAGEIIIFATTAGQPWFADPSAFAHSPIVLHLSLRDLTPAVIFRSINIVDDTEHALRAGTSLELAAQQVDDTSFIAADMPSLLRGDLEWARDRPVVFSPFGLGMLDIALANFVLQRAEKLGLGQILEGFFES